MIDTSTTEAAAPVPASPAVEACKRDKRGDVLAYSSMALLGLVIILLFFKGIPDGTTGTLIVTIATGVLALAGTVIGFQFGSSQGSQDKNATIAAQNPPQV